MRACFVLIRWPLPSTDSLTLNQNKASQLDSLSSSLRDTLTTTKGTPTIRGNLQCAAEAGSHGLGIQKRIEICSELSLPSHKPRRPSHRTRVTGVLEHPRGTRYGMRRVARSCLFSAPILPKIPRRPQILVLRYRAKPHLY